jgi:hypothetical protein
MKSIHILVFSIALGASSILGAAPADAREAVSPLRPCSIYYTFNSSGQVVGGFSSTAAGQLQPGSQWGQFTWTYRAVAVNLTCYQGTDPTG